MLLHFALIALFGVFLPWIKGLEFLDPPLISAYTCMGVLFAGPASAQAFAGGGPRRDGTESTRPQTMHDALRRLIKALVYGEGLVLMFLTAGILTVNLTHPGRIRLPQLDTLAGTFVLGFMASALVAVAAAWLSLRYSEQIARMGMRFFFVAMLIGYYYGSLRIPDFALLGASVGALITLSLFYFLWREVVPR